MKRVLMPLVLALSLTLAFALAQPVTPKRYALVVGINEYDHDKLGKLNYAVNDATKLAEVLREMGYEVVLITDQTIKKP